MTIVLHPARINRNFGLARLYLYMQISQRVIKTFLFSCLILYFSFRVVPHLKMSKK
jgi:hypothetical protein